MKVLLTGGAGFIGSHLSDSLLARGWNVTAIDDLSKGRVETIEHNLGRDEFTFEDMDARDSDRLFELGEGCDAVVHLAAMKIPRYASALGNLTVNLESSRSALEVARANGAKYVLSSTSDVYGRNTELPFREDGNCVIGPSTVKRWAYGVSKLCDEHLAFAYEEEYDLRVTVLRFFGSYGERQYLNWWGGPQGPFLDAITNGESMQVHGDGTQSRCFTYIDDMVEATARAIERDQANGEIINIGNDEEVSIEELAVLMHELSGKGGEPQIEFVPYDEVAPGYQDVLRRIPDLTKQRELLGFTPQIDLRQGIRRLWDWYGSEMKREERAPAG